MTRKILTALALAALVAMGALATVGVAGAGTAPQATVPVMGTASGGETFTGTMTTTGAAVQNGQTLALGTISGTLQDASGNRVGSVTAAPAAAPVAGDPCTLLSFSFGPFDITVIGITVHIDAIAANVTLSGLLGNLLCPLLGAGTTPAA